MFRHGLAVAAIGFVTGALLFAATLPASGDDFQGAAVLVQKLTAPPQPAAGAAATPDSLAHLRKDLADFSRQGAGLAPAEAAQQWLALFDRGMALKNSGAPMGTWGLAQTIFKALPGPESWPKLEKLIEARTPDKQPNPQDAALLALIVHTLNNEEQKQWADVALLGSLPANPADPAGGDNLASTGMLGSKLSAMSGQPDEVEKFWNRNLDALAKAPAVAAPADGYDEPQLELPDLVTLLGADRAEPLLQRALLLPQPKLTAISGVETQRLARKLALANVDKLPQAPWFLTESLEGSPLFEALRKKFPAEADSQAGAIYHVLALVIAGQQDEAVKEAATVDLSSLETAVAKAAEAGYGLQVYDFLHTLQQAHPENDCWSSYINLAAQTSHAQDALQFVKDTVARQDLSEPARGKVLAVYYRALLAVDQVDEGVAQLRTLIKDAQTTPQAAAKKRMTFNAGGRIQTVYMNGPDPEDQLMDWNIQLARLGHLLKRDALEAEGLDGARALAAKDQSSLISFLMETGRNVEAEKLLIDTIVQEAAQEKATAAAQPYNFYGGFRQNRLNLIKLAHVYYNAGRWADVITLLQEAPGWGAKDLVEVAAEKAYSERYSPPSLGLMAARALAETGQTDQARAVLDEVLQVDAGDDAAYALLLKIGQGDLVAKLDALYRQDQFQNRPLTWKATVLLQQGKIAEAEQACKAAIAVDPSDGETGKGDRMRVYSVMADICEAKNDTQQAAFFHNVVKAIRLSEDADDYYDAGLLTEAVGMYAKALDLFSDAYCIQSRIARQLAELGRMDEAAVHYRKAFELMPVSFGRMESHCFGCERAFQGKTAVAIAEQTFNDMLAKDPKKPQISYLLGYLYMEEERYPEALVHFQKAAELDPDYINAWKQIMEIGVNYQLSPDLRDAAVFNVIRLDPAGRHIQPTTEAVRELARLWSVEEAGAKAVPPEPATLFPLTVSAAEQDSLKEKMEKMVPNGMDTDMMSMLEEQMNMRMGRRPRDASAPRTAILENGVIATALQLFR